MRHDFSVPGNDAEHLDAQNYKWEAIRENNKQWLIIREWQIPTGYDQQKADLALLIGASYPDTQIDMVYFYPELSLTCGKEIKATNSKQALEGRQWQRWSRHRTTENPWRAGLDDISTHLTLVKFWLARELGK